MGAGALTVGLNVLGRWVCAEVILLRGILLNFENKRLSSFAGVLHMIKVDAV